MMCKILYALYGRDTRAAQVLNVIVAIWWATAMLLTYAGWVVFELPSGFGNEFTNELLFVMVLYSVAMVSFQLSGRARKVVKSFALLLGAIWQAIIANMYVSQYPPLSMMMCVSVVLSIWFVGAVFYIAKCEE